MPLAPEEPSGGETEARLSPQDDGQEPQAPTKAKRTVLFYVCASDLEGCELATHNLMQILSSNFSADGDVRFVVLTGGTNSRWMVSGDHL